MERRDVELRGEIAVPERKLSLVWSLRRNSDPTIPSSHIVELRFGAPGDVGLAGVHNVPGILMKASEEAHGTEVIGLQVRLQAGFFLIGLPTEDVKSNEALLKEGKWLDIPIIFDDGDFLDRFEASGSGVPGHARPICNVVGNERVHTSAQRLRSWAPRCPPGRDQGAVATPDRAWLLPFWAVIPMLPP
jgi:hypothetical protein